MMDRKWLANVKQEAKSELSPVGHNLDAVVKFKKHCDTKDPYYLYKINSREMNSDMPTFVFKASEAKANMALHMNEESGHFMKKEYGFFYGKVKRIKGLDTLTLSVYHPLPRKQIPLAVMDCEGENT